MRNSYKQGRLLQEECPAVDSASFVMLKSSRHQTDVQNSSVIRRPQHLVSKACNASQANSRPTPVHSKCETPTSKGCFCKKSVQRSIQHRSSCYSLHVIRLTCKIQVSSEGPSTWCPKHAMPARQTADQHQFTLNAKLLQARDAFARRVSSGRFSIVRHVKVFTSSD